MSEKTDTEDLIQCHCGMKVPRSLWLKHNSGHVLGMDGRKDGYVGHGVWRVPEAPPAGAEEP
jgi:hypothetical protein